MNGFVGILLPYLLYLILFISGYQSRDGIRADSVRHVPWTKTAIDNMYWGISGAIGTLWLTLWILLEVVDSPTPWSALGCGFEHGFPCPSTASVTFICTLAVLLVYDLRLLVRYPFALLFGSFIVIIWNMWGVIYIGAYTGLQATSGTLIGALEATLWHVLVMRSRWILGDEKRRLLLGNVLAAEKKINI